jgi:excisionase family DNA binding protein
MSDRLLTAAEVAELLAVPVSWVREHTRSTAIPHLVLGRYVRYRRDEVIAWLDTLTVGGGTRFRRYTPVDQQGPATLTTSRPRHQEVSPDATAA